MRDIQVQQFLVEFLTQQYEQARIEEVRNTPTLIRIDPPTVPTKRIWPRRGLVVLVTAVMAFLFACAVAVTRESVANALRDDRHPNHSRIKALHDTLAP
jgi:uncharacterized protein involved in exopolysaccharide biosynthesis